MYDTSEFRRGLKIEIDDNPYTIVFFQHVKPGKGNQFTRTKLKNLFTGYVLDRTFRSGEKVEKPDLEFEDCTFLYQDGDIFHFMNQSSYEQFEITEEQLGDAKKYLIPDLSVQLMFFRGRTANIELPTFVELAVKQSDPGVKGDTASGGTKPATMETGLTVYVPFHINEGDVLKIDTRTGEYAERVKRA